MCEYFKVLHYWPNKIITYTIIFEKSSLILVQKKDN